MKDHLLSGGYIGPNDFAFFHYTHDVDEAVALINTFYRRYHSLRFVDGKCVIRMVSELADTCIGELKQEFADLMADGGDMCFPARCPRSAMSRNSRSCRGWWSTSTRGILRGSGS